MSDASISIVPKKLEGRPTKFKAEYHNIAEEAAKLGATDKHLAAMFDVSERTLNTWKQQHPKFLQSIAKAKQDADANVEKALYQRAIGYEHEDTHFATCDGRIISESYVKHYAPDVTAIQFWLKNRRPDLWRDVQRIELQANVTVSVETMSVEDLRADMIRRGEMSPEGKLLTQRN